MNLPELFKLTGVVIVLVGLALKLRTTLVVVAAGLATGLIAGLPLFTSAGAFEGVPLLTKPGQEGIVNMLGATFVENRRVTLFILTLPAIGLAERYGLQERAALFIRRVRAATVGRLLIVYQLFRVLMGILGIRLLGHPAFVRPLVFPMAVGAAEETAGVRDAEKLPTDEVERIKAAASASENYGNFYGQNLSPVQAGILLVYDRLAKLGYTVSVWSLVYYAIPIAAASVLLAALQFWLFDLWLRRRLRTAHAERGEAR